VLAAIAECHTVDEVKDIRGKALALEVYSRQIQNTDLERQFSTYAWARSASSMSR
jgi:hypothetical protein